MRVAETVERVRRVREENKFLGTQVFENLIEEEFATDRLNCQRNRRQNNRADVLETKRGHSAQCYKISKGSN